MDENIDLVGSLATSTIHTHSFPFARFWADVCASCLSLPSLHLPVLKSDAGQITQCNVLQNMFATLELLGHVSVCLTYAGIGSPSLDLGLDLKLISNTDLFYNDDVSHNKFILLQEIDLGLSELQLTYCM